MKKIAILLILMSLNDSSFAQSIADALEQNDRQLLPAAVEAAVTFRPGGPTFVQQNSGWREMESHKSSPHTESVPDSISCADWYWVGNEYVSEGDYETGKDTLEAYIEHCYASPGSPDAFPQIGSAVGSIAQQNEWLAFRNWLFSVLYLNPDTIYYCSDADQLIPTFVYDEGPRGDDTKGQLAVEQYLVESGKCPAFDTGLVHSLKANWHAAYLKWQDTVKDSLANPFDSTLPTLQQIGFQLLLGPQYAIANNGILPTSMLGNIGIAPNPFLDNTVIDYSLNVPATLTVEVFNVLGQRVASPVPSVLTTNGAYLLTLTGSAIASGTYYVRFSVPEGEVQTLKVVKE